MLKIRRLTNNTAAPSHAFNFSGSNDKFVMDEVTLRPDELVRLFQGQQMTALYPIKGSNKLLTITLAVQGP